jgi:hypothetical protein
MPGEGMWCGDSVGWLQTEEALMPGEGRDNRQDSASVEITCGDKVLGFYTQR